LCIRHPSPSRTSEMGRKRKATAARAEGLRVAQEALSAKRQRSTPGDSDLSGSEEEKTSDDEIVRLYHVKFSRSTT
jgi:hypothetical protein